MQKMQDMRFLHQCTKNCTSFHAKPLLIVQDCDMPAHFPPPVCIGWRFFILLEQRDPKARTVYFSEKTAKEQRRWIQFKDRYCESDLLFPVKHHGGQIGEPTFERNFKQYVKRTGITKHVTPHTIRNNFAKRCLMAGMDIYTLSRLLGHSSVEVTEKAYLDLTDADVRKKYGRFSPIDSIYQ